MEQGSKDFKPIYLDSNASTPLLPEVIEEMTTYLTSGFGNPSCSHVFGRTSKRAVDLARKRVAELLGCKVEEVCFTSGGTESNNMAIRGVLLGNKQKGGHIISSVIEHPAIKETCRALQNEGLATWDECPVNSLGIIDLTKLKELIRKDTVLVSVMHANNQTGSIQPIQKIAKICKEHGIIFHTDAAQSVGKLDVNVDHLGVDLLSVAGHKLYAPKGVGALYIRSGVKMAKLMQGATHERNRRPGTENIISLAGFGKACELARTEVRKRHAHYCVLWKLLFEGIRKKLGEQKVVLNGPEDVEFRLANTLSLSFPGIKANLILDEFRDTIAVSAGAACCEAGMKISYVLTAMGIPKDVAMGAIRFSFGVTNTKEEITRAIPMICSTIRKLSKKK